eukprot:Ihof_evm10s109 gene=Ihof_evmTU10s109
MSDDDVFSSEEYSDSDRDGDLYDIDMDDGEDHRKMEADEEFEFHILKPKDLIDSQLKAIEAVNRIFMVRKAMRLSRGGEGLEALGGKSMGLFLGLRSARLTMFKIYKKIKEIPNSTARQLLYYFGWDKERLLERYYEDPDRLFQEANVINPNKAKKM